MKIRKSPRSGKRGNVVASRNHFGPYEREHTSPKKERTPAQQSSQAQFGAVAKVWDQLTEPQRQAWIAQAKEAKSKSRLSERWSLTGQTYFIRVNNSRVSFGLGILRDPPPLAPPRDNPVGRLIITNRGGRISLKLEVAELPVEAIMVFAAAPCNQGVSRCFKCPRLGLLPAPVGGFSDITRLYVQRYGLPPVGKRVFIRTRQQSDGRPDRYLETSAVVPDRPTRRDRAKGA